MVIHWFRRDLRLYDNSALSAATSSGEPVLCLFIFDSEILDSLNSKSDLRVNFIYRELMRIKTELNKYKSDLLIRYGKVDEVWEEVLREFNPKAVYANEDYEPYAFQRDESIENLMRLSNVQLILFKDQVVFHKSEIVKDDGKPYTVYTPYKNKWLKKFQKENLDERPVEMKSFAQCTFKETLTLEDIGFEWIEYDFPSRAIDSNTLNNYSKKRDDPAADATSRLSVHLRFGTISIRECHRVAQEHSQTWRDELIWRSFFMQLLYHFPNVVHEEFREKYRRMVWRQSDEDFRAWKEGKTGFPIVDAGMRELSQTGFMHNRVRMIVASFLCKHLLIDWRLGEAWFAEKLIDFELASNNGNWQWAAGTGADAAPYFRIFNPINQQQKFDPNYKYVKRWVPEWGTSNYPKPVLDLKVTRVRCLEAFKNNLEF